jgi:4-carboxymuconolactone decarboxylase
LRVWLHSPALAEQSQALGAYCRYHTGLPARLTELAIIVIGAYWKAGFEWHVHAPIAEKAGIAASAIDEIRQGKEPEDLASDERLVFRFTRSMITDRTVPADMFAALEDELGSEGVVNLVGVIGYYSYIAMTIIAFDVDTPGGDPFP